MVNVLIGTNNTGKYTDAARMAVGYPELLLHKPADLGIVEDADETGDTYVENAHLKRDFYISELLRLGLHDYFVVCDDSGLEIDALNGEPGIHSRRWKDGTTPMTDQEIIDYVLERLKGVPKERRTAGFAGVIALGHTHKDLNIDIPYRLDGVLLEEPVEQERQEGYPFRSLFYLPKYKAMLSTIVSLPPDQRPAGFLSHREIGLKTAYDKLMKLTK